MLLETVKRYADLVVLPHSVFALPFALSGLLLASQQADARTVSGWTLVCVLGAVVCARTAAMGFNRLVDSKIDALNPRTSMRHLPQRLVSRGGVVALIFASSTLFLVFSALLGMHCLVLAPFVLGVLFAYSYAKRVTALAHMVLGLALALAPGGAWWVLVPRVDSIPLVLMCAVLFWVAGFDILYSCQDVDFDSAQELHSIPAALGVEKSLQLAFFFHSLASVLFLALGPLASLPTFYSLGVVVLGVVLLSQHRLVSAADLSRINRAFFTYNGVVSIGFFMLIAAAVFF